MSKIARAPGATSQILQVFIPDSTSPSGAGLTGLLYNSAGLTAYFHRDTDTTATAISLVTMTVGTFTSSGFKEIDATNLPGWYQFCPPNAALASGAKSCAFLLKGAANMVPTPLELDLDARCLLMATGSDAFTESYNADGAAGTLPQLLYLIAQRLTEFTISGTTMTVKKLDGSTTAFTETLNDATNPTGITRAT